MGCISRDVADAPLAIRVGAEHLIPTDSENFFYPENLQRGRKKPRSEDQTMDMLDQWKSCFGATYSMDQQVKLPTTWRIEVIINSTRQVCHHL
jgi:hypothetical protein